MPTLADIYSAIDSAKRKGSDFVRNPGASLQQMVGLANDRAGALNELTSQAAMEGGRYGPKSQQLANQMAEGYNPIGMTVYHGSPHLFQRFDLNKIGTGEGAQAYGSGMYMAENPAVAKDYMFTLSGDVNAKGSGYYPKVNGKVVYDDFDDIDIVRKIAAKTEPQSGGIMGRGARKAISSDDAIGELIEKNKQFANDPIYYPEARAKALEEIQSLRKYLGQNIEPSKPSLYKVDLSDTHVRRMLDLDAPLKDQPTPVRKIAKALGLDMNNLGNDLLEKVGKDEKGRKTLQDAGIRGVKYLDQQSRDVGKGTRNFVVFDPSHMTVLERNSQPIN